MTEDQLAQTLLQRGFVPEIELRWGAPNLTQDFFGVLGRAEPNFCARGIPWFGPTEEQNLVLRLPEVEGHGIVKVGQRGDDANNRSWLDAFAQGFVIQADVARGGGCFESRAGRGGSVDARRELPHERRFLGIAEVQA